MSKKDLFATLQKYRKRLGVLNREFMASDNSDNCQKLAKEIRETAERVAELKEQYAKAQYTKA